MANSQSVTWGLTVKAVETIDVDAGAAEFLLVGTNPTQLHQFILSGVLNGTSAPAATKIWSSRCALTAGADTIDLTALTGQSGTTIDMSGLEVILIAILNNGANVMTFSDGASNGYPVFGGTSEQVKLGQGAGVMMYTADKIGQVVDATHKTIDVAGTTTQTYDILIVCG